MLDTQNDTGLSPEATISKMKIVQKEGTQKAKRLQARGNKVSEQFPQVGKTTSLEYTPRTWGWTGKKFLQVQSKGMKKAAPGGRQFM